MTKRIVILSVAVLLIAGAALAGEKGEEKTWTGWVTDTNCGMRGDNQAEHSACAKRCASRGAGLALVSSKGKLFKLDPRDKVVDNAGEYVKVKGTLKDDVITVSSIMKVEKAEDYAASSACRTCEQRQGRKFSGQGKYFVLPVLLFRYLSLRPLFTLPKHSEGPECN